MENENPKGTKERILDLALELFSERGYAGVSIADIVERIGIKKASFYHHFTAKSALLDAVFARFLGRLESGSGNPAALGAALERLGAAGFLAEGLRLYLARYAEPAMAQIIRLAQVEQYREERARRFLLEALYGAPFRAAEQALGLILGTRGDRRDPALLAASYQAALMLWFQEYLLAQHAGADTAPVRQRMEAHIALFCREVLHLEDN